MAFTDFDVPKVKVSLRLGSELVLVSSMKVPLLGQRSQSLPTFSLYLCLFKSKTCLVHVPVLHMQKESWALQNFHINVSG